MRWRCGLPFGIHINHSRPLPVADYDLPGGCRSPMGLRDRHPGQSQCKGQKNCEDCAVHLASRDKVNRQRLRGLKRRNPGPGAPGLRVRSSSKRFS